MRWSVGLASAPSNSHHTYLKIVEAKVLGMGNALVDILVRVPNDKILSQFNLPKGSMQLVDDEQSAEIVEAVKGLHPTIVSGGSSANAIYGLANLGIQTGFLGKIGVDELGKRYEADLEVNGVDPILKKSQTHSGSCISLITPDSERTMCTCLGAAVELTKEDLDEALFESYTHFYVEGFLVQNPELIECALKMAHEKGLTTILDLASYNTVEDNLEFMQRLISRYVDVVFANEEEATAFTGKEDEEALNEIGELADIVILKQGRRGSLVKVGHERLHCGIIECNAIDTTGAGDLYAAGFLWGLIGGLQPIKCATAGAILSGNVIEVIGSKMDANRWTSIRQELKKL